MANADGNMAAAEPNVTLYHKELRTAGSGNINRETADDEDRVDYRAHYKMSAGAATDSATSARWPVVHPYLLLIFVAPSLLVGIAGWTNINGNTKNLEAPGPRIDPFQIMLNAKEFAHSGA
jgi:hypothetical protein